ncbi:MAG: TRAP transporter small permease [Proteobacteria bacterium]|nr:TRAP transporter small permease [Pseudomonadota bacterium]
MDAKLSRKIEKGFHFLALFLSVTAALGMIAIVVIIVISVFMRKFFNYPLFFSEEIVGILMSVSLFLALPMVTLNGTHIRISIFTEFLKRRSRLAYKITTYVSYLIGVVFCLWLLVEAVPWLQFAIKHNLKTETARLLLYPWMISLPLSILLMLAIFIARLFGFIKSNEKGNS